MNDFAVTVVITCKDRKDDLRRALVSFMKQKAEPEILVIDDGSSDGNRRDGRARVPDGPVTSA